MKYRVAAAFLTLFFVTMAYGQVQFLGGGAAFPQVVVGGDTNATNYVTIIQIVNSNSAPTTAHLGLFGDSGSTLAVQFDGDSPQATKDITLASGETRQIQLTL